MKNWVAFSGTAEQKTAGIGRQREILNFRKGCGGRNPNAIINPTKDSRLIMLDREGFRPNVGIILLNQHQ